MLTQMLHVWYIYLHNWVMYVGQMLGFIFQHHGAYGLFPIYSLVGGWPTPLKNMKVSWDDEIPNNYSQLFPIIPNAYQAISGT